MGDELVLAIKRVAARKLVEKIETVVTRVGFISAGIDRCCDARARGGEEGGRDAE